MNQPDRAQRVAADEALEVAGQEREPGQWTLVSFLMAFFFFLATGVAPLIFVLLAPLEEDEVGLVEWWLRVVFASPLVVAVIWSFLGGLYVVFSRRTIRLEPDGLKVIRRPVPIGHLVRYERSQIVGAETGVPITGSKRGVAAVLLLLDTGERRVLLLTTSLEEATALTWEITDYYGLTPRDKPVPGIHKNDHWYPIVNGQIDMRGVAPWGEERLVKESVMPWRVTVKPELILVRACVWLLDGFLSLGVIWAAMIFIAYLFDRTGIFYCYFVPLGVLGLPSMLILSAMKRNPRTLISPGLVSVKSGLAGVGVTKQCRPEDIQRITYLLKLDETDDLGKAEIVLVMSTRADAAEIDDTATGFVSPGQMVGLAHLIANRLPARVGIGPDAAVLGAQDQKLSAAESQGAGLPLAEPPSPATNEKPDLSMTRGFELNRRWGLADSVAVICVVVLIPFFLVYIYGNYERIEEKLSPMVVIILGALGITILLSGLTFAAWLMFRRSYFVVQNGRLKFDVHSLLGRRTVHDLDGSKVEGLWLLNAPGMNEQSCWPCWLCVKSDGRYRLHAMGYWETFKTTARAMRQTRQALGIQPMEQETCFGVVHRGVLITSDEHARYRVPANPGFDPVQRGPNFYKRDGEHGWRSVDPQNKQVVKGLTYLFVSIAVLWLPMLLNQTPWMRVVFWPGLILLTAVFAVMILLCVLSSMRFETIQVNRSNVTGFRFEGLKFKTMRYSHQEILAARVYVEHRFTDNRGSYEVWFQLAVPDELTESPRVMMDRISSYEEACEILEDLKAGSERARE